MLWSVLIISHLNYDVNSFPAISQEFFSENLIFRSCGTECCIHFKIKKRKSADSIYFVRYSAAHPVDRMCSGMVYFLQQKNTHRYIFTPAPFCLTSQNDFPLILEPVQHLFAHVFSVNFTAFCVKNSCRATARLRIFALKSAKIHSKIHARQDTKQALIESYLSCALIFHKNIEFYSMIRVLKRSLL